jgi:predicted MPP superfamily phosphohydrolase
VYVVKGNTDWVDGLQKITEGTNVEVLDNRIVELEYGTTTIQLGGITLLGGDEFGAGRTARQLMSPVGPDLRIALAHNPDEIERFEESPVDLLVVGHTHGGQVSIPFFGPPVTLTGVPRSVAAGGLHELDGTPIYVSTGVGRERGNAPQIRFGVRPSIGIIDIVPE